MFFLPPYIITIIKRHGEEGDCAEDLSCGEGDKGVQELNAECAVTASATGVGRQAVPAGWVTFDDHRPPSLPHCPGQSPRRSKQTLYKAWPLNPIGMLAARCCSWHATPALCSSCSPPANLCPELCCLFLASRGTQDASPEHILAYSLEHFLSEASPSVRVVSLHHWAKLLSIVSGEMLTCKTH